MEKINHGIDNIIYSAAALTILFLQTFIIFCLNNTSPLALFSELKYSHVSNVPVRIFE